MLRVILFTVPCVRLGLAVSDVQFYFWYPRRCADGIHDNVL